MTTQKPLVTVMAVLFAVVIVAFAPVAQTLSLRSLSLSLYGTISASAPSVYFDMDPNSTLGKNDFSFGFALSSDWNLWCSKTILQQMASDANFKLVRFFSVDVEPCSYWNETSGNGNFNWTNVDRLVQKIYDTGSQPLISIGYYNSRILIPPGMRIDPVTELPSPQTYASYCREWVKHFEAAEFPVRFYEILNEASEYFYPNWIWNDTRAEYFLQLFSSCYDAMHNENPQVCVGDDCSLYTKFLDFWIAQGAKLDMLSFHEYDCNSLSMDSETPLLRAEQRFSENDWCSYGVSYARQRWFNATGVTLPVIDSETNWCATFENGTDPRIQETVGTVWLALVTRKNILEHVNYSCYYHFTSSGTWEQATKASGGLGFGMINSDGNQPWYPYYLQRIIGTSLSVGDDILPSNTSSDNVESIAWVHSNRLNIMLVCKVDEPRTVLLRNVSGQLNFTRIDGSISYLSPKLQTGIINAVDPLTMNGYCVVLLQGEA